MKVRVLQKDDIFYPQYRFCFMWSNFKRYPSYKGIKAYPKSVRYDMEEAAIEYIREFHKRKLQEKAKKVRKVVWEGEF